MLPSSPAALNDLRTLVDEAIEVALVEHQSLAELMGRLLPVVRERLGATVLFFETFGEDLALQRFQSPDDATLSGLDEIARRTADDARELVRQESPTGTVIAQPIDVAGEWFGRAALELPAGLPPEAVEHAAAGLGVLAELLDNHLFAIRAAREKHLVMMEIGNALRHRVLSCGLATAVSILSRAVPLDRLVLLYASEEPAERSTLRVELFEGGVPVDDPAARLGLEAPRLRALGRACLTGESRELLERFGARGAQEEVLINGLTNGVLVGKVVATAKRGSFNTYDRDLIASFAGFVRQRVVDFNKEWRSLALAFRPDDVARLLSSEDYVEAYLAPREAEVAVLYVDISGFTRVSEQVLRTPANVAAFVERWSTRAVDLVWKHGGVFDKMVGDCVIALFGPPFYDASPEERLAAALRCARDIRAMTNALPEEPELASLRGANVGVASGVNLAPLFVGQFGPNANFTGFSSGMNNTARLQGCATKDQVLVMEAAARRLSTAEFAFSEPAAVTVKNVAEPLRYVHLVG
ncbi:MAG TPA: adenylate/guanylate cyclase domain-containing protein [Polyangiaceae bacterium]|nr:adenylate/guanylate cyclase domain-containing protein [Polyangiaceae bacterium]